MFLTGDIGIGKSTALQHIGQGWTKGSVDELKQFDLVFYLALNGVSEDENIEDIILKQHKFLAENQVKSEEIKAIVERDGKWKVLLLLDECDVYNMTKGKDKPQKDSLRNVDQAITKKCMEKCWVIVTSTEREQLQRIREHMDAEAQIVGFGYNGYIEYRRRYLGEGKHKRVSISGIINVTTF